MWLIYNNKGIQSMAHCDFETLIFVMVPALPKRAIAAYGSAF